MKIVVKENKQEMGLFAAVEAAKKLNEAIAKNGEARLILATGESQFEVVKALAAQDVDWSKVTMFHLDEYVNLPESHIASFRKYLKERFADHVNLKAAHYVNGEGDVEKNIAELTAILREAPVDVAMIGIGENAHIAFNDPPADFDTREAYIVVDLDEKCRMQQVGEGWFPDLAAVPTHAYSMTVKQIMWSRAIVCTCPDARKADAVKGCIEGPVTNTCPGSILQMHPNCAFFFDPPAAALLSAR